MTSIDTTKALESAVLQLFKLVQRMREELSGVTGTTDVGGLDRAADQLSSIAEEQQKAAAEIVEATQKIADVTALLSKEIKYAGARQFFDTLKSQSDVITEATKRHEAMAEKIASIVQTINTVEGTINSLVVTLGDGNAQGLPSAIGTIGKGPSSGSD